MKIKFIIIAARILSSVKKPFYRVILAALLALRRDREGR